MFGNENNVREIEEAMMRQQSSAFGSYFDFDNLVRHVQNLKLTAGSGQCGSLFTMENLSPSGDPVRLQGGAGADGGEEAEESNMMEIDGDDDGIGSKEERGPHGDGAFTAGKSAEDDDTTILNVPVQAFLHILHFLDAKDICSLSGTCTQFNSFCDDQLLWKSLLNKDMVKWSEVSRGKNPTNYTASEEAVDYKDVYMRCNPELKQDATFNLSSIPRLLWSFLPHRAPLVIMFGPGLETDTSTIVRKLITGHGSDIVKVIGVTKAMFQGIGSAFEVMVNNKSRLRLVVMYSGFKKEREARRVENQPRTSKLIKRVAPPREGVNNDAAVSEEGDMAAASNLAQEEDTDYLNFEPNDQVKAMCQVVGGFIFVVDAAQQQSKVSCSSGRPELFAFMNSKWTPEKKPLLVLSSVATADTPRLPCVKVADELSLHRLQRPWKVVDCEVSSLDGLSEGVDWLVGSTH